MSDFSAPQVEYRSIPSDGHKSYCVGSDQSVWSLTKGRDTRWRRLKPIDGAWADITGRRIRTADLVREAFSGPPADLVVTCCPDCGHPSGRRLQVVEHVGMIARRPPKPRPPVPIAPEFPLAPAGVEYRRVPSDGNKWYCAGSDGSVWTLIDRPGEVWQQLQGECLLGKYRRVRIGKKRAFVGRLVLEAFEGPPTDAEQVCRHHNGDPADDRRDNLFWGPRKRIEGVIGPDCKRSKRAVLTCQAARDIVRRHRDGEHIKHLARAYGVSWTAVYNVVKGICWSHATGLHRNGRAAHRRVIPITEAHASHVDPASTD